MEQETKKAIRDFLEQRVAQVRVLVLGDIMLDRYFYGDVTRISPEAPVPVNRIEKKKDTLGGAANVAHNLAQLGCQTYLAGAIGDDHHGRVLQRKLKKREIHTEGIFLGREKTTTKIRILGGHQQMIRLDFEETDTIAEATRKRLEQYVDERMQLGLDAIILSDYGKGICTPQLCQDVIKKASGQGLPVFVDPKGSDWEKYAGADYITPNVKEAGLVIGTSLANEDQALREAAGKIKASYGIQSIMITRSEKGISLFGHNREITIPTLAQEVFDVSGAGDTVISVFSAAVSSGMNEDTAVQMANYAAGIEVGKLGTYAVSREDILSRLITCEF